MPAGLFGKLPAKRDFIAANAPRRFLEVWEPWLQAGVATSKQMLGRGMGRRVQSRADLALLARRRLLRRGDDRRFHAFGRRRRPILSPRAVRGEGEDSLPPPEIESNDAWCEAAEAMLLDALDPGATLEASPSGSRRCRRPP